MTTRGSSVSVITTYKGGSHPVDEDLLERQISERIATAEEYLRSLNPGAVVTLHDVKISQVAAGAEHSQEIVTTIVALFDIGSKE